MNRGIWHCTVGFLRSDCPMQRTFLAAESFCNNIKLRYYRSLPMRRTYLCGEHFLTRARCQLYLKVTLFLFFVGARHCIERTFSLTKTESHVWRNIQIIIQISFWMSKHFCPNPWIVFSSWLLRDKI